MEKLVTAWVRWRRWTPIGTAVTIWIDDSGDSALLGNMVSGIVRASDRDEEGTLHNLLVELAVPMDYAGHYVRRDIRWLVMSPCLRWRRTDSLARSWAAFRIVDAPSFRDATFGRTIGVGRARVAGRAPMHFRR